MTTAASTGRQARTYDYPERAPGRVKAAREAWGWTQQELAEAAGTSRGTVVALERGDTVSLKTIFRLYAALGLDREEDRVDGPDDGAADAPPSPTDDPAMVAVSVWEDEGTRLVSRWVGHLPDTRLPAVDDHIDLAMDGRYRVIRRAWRLGPNGIRSAELLIVHDPAA